MNTLTINGNTKFDRAYEIWHSEMTPIQRAKIMSKVKDYKQTARKYRACLNYIAEGL